MKGPKKTVLIAILTLVLTAAFLIFFLQKKEDVVYANTGDLVELSFELDKKLTFGDYYFNVDNGKGSTYPLCFCLAERNMYPPDCSGDVKYLYKNTPGTMCIPLTIGSGRCSATAIKTMGYATDFIIPLEYSWIKPFQKIVIGIRVPPQAPDGARLITAVSIFKQGYAGKMERCRMYEKTIIVREAKNKF